MKIDIPGILNGEPRAMKGLMSVIRKSARIACNKIGAESIEEDVAQEVAVLFLNRLIHKFDESYNAEPLLIETCRRVALAMLRRNREVCVEDVGELIDNENDAINIHDDLDSSPVSYLDQQKALKALGMAKGLDGQQRKRAGNNHAGNKPRGRSVRMLSESCARLREIRVSLGIPQESFSAQLGIPTATLLSYEYGRTRKVPDHIMEKAEEIFEREHVVAKQTLAQAERPMREIINEWAELLQVEPDDVTTISEILGVAKSTIHRWMDGEMRPRPRELNAYIRSVKLIAKRIRSGNGEISK